MRLIEISADKFINLDSICSVQIRTQSEKKRADLGYGLKGKPKKVGEISTMAIITADGASQHVEPGFFAQVYDELFPDTAP